MTAVAPTVASTRAVIGCPDCGTRQQLPPSASGDMLSCVTCTSPLERRFGQSLTAALCCSAATLLLLLPANLATFLTTEAFGVSRHSYLASTAGSILEGGWPWLALVIFLFVVVFPLRPLRPAHRGAGRPLSRTPAALAWPRLPLGQ